MADVNGDNAMDIVWNHVNANTNETVIALSNGDGTFNLQSTFRHSKTPLSGWSRYVTKVGDFNNDGRDDLAWGSPYQTNLTYIGVSNGDGSFDEMPVFVKGAASWRTDYQFEVGDIDGRNGDDLVWNVRNGTNRTYVTFSNGDGTFGVNQAEPTAGYFQDHPARPWSNTESFQVADFDGNGRNDLIWYTEGASHHHVYFAESLRDTPGNVFNFRGLYDRRSNGWTGYKVLVGDIDGNAGADLVWIDSINNNPPAIHRDITTGGVPALTSPAFQLWESAKDLGEMKHALLDVNGDGRMDILSNKMDSFNRSFIGLGTSSGEFDLGRVSQDHPELDDWSQFQILTGDVDGDGRDDIVYNSADAGNSIYVAIAKE